MSLAAVLAPLFVEVALTLALLWGLGVTRSMLLQSGAVRTPDIALGQPGWPARVTQVGNAFSNQFELPVLFYVLTILALHTRHAGLLFVVLAWVFVISRLVHALIHVTGNNVRLRGAVWGLGAAVLTVMWAIFAIEILLGI